MTTNSHEQGKHEQERACARTFLDWLGSQRSVKYGLHRAEEYQNLNGRWDFVAPFNNEKEWLALEIKGLVIPQSFRQYSSWSRICNAVTKKLKDQGSVQGSFSIFASVPWAFDQKQAKLLSEALVKAMIEETPNSNSGDLIDLGPAIAILFEDWPTEPPKSDNKLWHEQQIYKIIHQPKELLIYKLEDNGCSLECDVSFSEVFTVDPSLYKAVLSIFNSKAGKDAKPNVQLLEAKEKGASEAILLLDSHIRWRPNIVADVLRLLDQALLSSIDSVYLVSVYNNRVRKVWP